MKKLVIGLLCLTMLLTACGGEKPAETTEKPTEAVTEAVTEAATEEATEAAPAETEEATEADRKALAESCIDKPVEELYDLIGEPDSAEYGPSCLGDGEDGNLDYGDFIVYTYRDDAGETVQFVE